MIPNLTEDILNISKLPDTVEGRAEWLKMMFDEAGRVLKEYINGTLVPYLNSFNPEEIIQSPQGLYLRIINGVPEFSEDGVNWNVFFSSLVVKDHYNTLVDLETAHPTGNIGDNYVVGSTGTLYVWNGTNWTNIGNLQGAKGEGVPSGGFKGAFLRKTSIDDYATHWDGIGTDTIINDTNLDGAVLTDILNILSERIYKAMGTFGTEAPVGGQDGDLYFRYKPMV